MKNLATRIFENSGERGRLEDEFCDAALAAFGVASNDFDNWPFCDFHFDSYDASFELTECRPGVKLTTEQCSRFWAMGFACGWLNYHDGTEPAYFSRTGESRPKRKVDGVYLEPVTNE